MAGLMTTVIAGLRALMPKRQLVLACRLVCYAVRHSVLLFRFLIIYDQSRKCAKEADTAAFSRLNWTTMLSSLQRMR